MVMKDKGLIDVWRGWKGENNAASQPAQHHKLREPNAI